MYQLLAFEGVPPPPPVLAEFDAGSGRVISLGSFAKIAAPALRLGWLHVALPAGQPLFDRIANCGLLDSSGGLNPVISGIVHAFIDSGEQAAHIAVCRTELTQRCATLCDALRTHLPRGASFVQPRGGYFVWIALPPGLKGSALAAHAVASHKLRFHPGVRFGDGLEGFIRLSFSFYGAADLALGAERLGEAMRSLGDIVANSLAVAPSSPAPATAAIREAGAPLRVAIHGASGRLGALIAGLAAQGTGVLYKGAVARGGAPLPADDVDVIIDVSLPAGTTALVAAMLAAQRTSRPPALVVGTTGSGLPHDALAAYGRLAPVVVCPNFSAGVPLALAMLAACGGGGAPSRLPPGWHAEVTEMHHTAKRDAPSGTAKRLVHGLYAAGVTAADGVAAIPVHSLRLGDTVGIHTVHLAGPGERLELTHTATRRDVFAAGALRVAAWAVGQPPGVYER